MNTKTVENIYEVEQISLLTTYTTKLRRYYRVTLHYLNFRQKISENSTPPVITSLWNEDISLNQKSY